jgi:hypothetical protein
MKGDSHASGRLDTLGSWEPHEGILSPRASERRMWLSPQAREQGRGAQYRKDSVLKQMGRLRDPGSPGYFPGPWGDPTNQGRIAPSNPIIRREREMVSLYRFWPAEAIDAPRPYSRATPPGIPDRPDFLNSPAELICRNHIPQG